MLKIYESLEGVTLQDLGFNDNYFKNENVYIHRLQKENARDIIQIRRF